MGKGLSNIQKVIIEELKNNNGCKCWELRVKAKIKLYPELYWVNSSKQIFPYFDYGKNIKEKNKARATISRAIKRLIQRGIISKDKSFKYYYNG
jgi:hypothetical protein